MDVINKSLWNYRSFRLAINADMDLGYPHDDYIGFDSARRLGYVYNGNTVDGTGQSDAYGNTPPVAGYTLLALPGDNSIGNEPAGSFMTFNNDNSAAGNPVNASEFHSYMNSRFRDGKHLNNDFAGKGTPSFGRGTGPQANYMFTGNPADTNAWSECNCYNPVGDRRFVLSTGDILMYQLTKVRIAFALVTTNRGANNACPGVDITGVKEVTDTAWKYYRNPPASRLAVKDVVSNKLLQLHPNPANDILNISLADDTLPSDITLAVYDITGRKMNVGYSAKGDNIQADVSLLPPGIYSIRLCNAEINKAAVFVKE